MRILVVVLLLNAVAAPALGGTSGDRVVSKSAIVATHAPDRDHAYPAELESLVPIEQSSLVVSTHRGRERGDEVVIWAKVSGGYRRVKTFVSDPGMGAYAPVRAFGYDGQLFLIVSFVFSGTAGAVEDTVLAVEQYEGELPMLTKVEIQPPIDWFRQRLGDGEASQDDAVLTFADGKLEWSLGIWRTGDAHCCPSAGRVRGTFDVCRERHHDEATGRWSSTWRMLVHDGTREPIGAEPRREFGQIRDWCLPGEVRGSALLPDASGRLPGHPRQ